MSNKILSRYDSIRRNADVIEILLRESSIMDAFKVYSNWKLVMEANEWSNRDILVILQDVFQRMNDNNVLASIIETWIGLIQIELMYSEF